MFNTIKKDLPDLPDDVISDWLAPLTPASLWPPDCSLPKWRGILLGESLHFWSSLVWKMEKLNMSGITFVKRSNDVINEMYAAHVMSVDNAFLEHIDSRKSFLFSLKHILKHGHFQKPLIFLQREEAYELADGHHRYLAFVMANQICQMSNSSSAEARELCKKLKEKWNINEIVPVDNFHDVWVAKP